MLERTCHSVSIEKDLVVLLRLIHLRGCRGFGWFFSRVRGRTGLIWSLKSGVYRVGSRDSLVKQDGRNSGLLMRLTEDQERLQKSRKRSTPSPQVKIWARAIRSTDWSEAIVAMGKRLFASMETEEKLYASQDIGWTTAEDFLWSNFLNREEVSWYLRAKYPMQPWRKCLREGETLALPEQWP